MMKLLYTVNTQQITQDDNNVTEYRVMSSTECIAFEIQIFIHNKLVKTVCRTVNIEEVIKTIQGYIGVGILSSNGSTNQEIWEFCTKMANRS